MIVYYFLSVLSHVAVTAHALLQVAMAIVATQFSSVFHSVMVF